MDSIDLGLEGADSIGTHLLGRGRGRADDCTRSDANTEMHVPAEFGNPATCFMQAQAYLVGNSIRRELDANERGTSACGVSVFAF